MKRDWTNYCLVMCLLMSGCADFDAASGASESIRLISLWKTYVHCRSSRDLDEMRADSHWLRRQAFSFRSGEPVRLLPKAAANVLAELPSRLAVDPDALAADCSLRAGLEAQARSKPALAAAIFRIIAKTYSVGRYAYYVERARNKLDEIESIASLPDPGPEAIVSRSSDEHGDYYTTPLVADLVPGNEAVIRR